MKKDVKSSPDIKTSSIKSEKLNLEGDRRILLTILPLIVLVCLSVWSLKSSPPILGIDSNGGVWDTRDFDFSSAIASLWGEVEYIPYALLSPEEFAASEHIIVGHIPQGTDYLTSRVRIIAPTGNHAFLRKTPDNGCRIYVNGDYIGGVGTPSESKETAVPGEKEVFFTAQPRDGIIEIVVQSSNYAYKETSDHSSWRMGSEEQISRNVTGKTAATVFMMGFLILLFVVHMLLFLMLPSYRANFWLALLCLMWALRTGCTGIKILLILVPGLSWTAAFRIEYIAIPATLVLVTLAYHHLFPGVLQKGFRIALICVAGAFTAIYLFTPTLFMSKTIVSLEIIAIIAAIYVLLRLIIKVHKPNTEQSVILIGLVVVLAALVMDTLWYNNIITYFHVPGAIMEYAFAGFSMFQMTALFFGTMREVAATREREKRLAVENAALDSLSRMKTEYMANMSHDMKTPMTVISVHVQRAAELTERSGADNKNIRVSLNRAQEEIMRVSRMAENTLNLASMQESREHMKPLDISALLTSSTEVYRAMIEKRENRLNIRIAENLPQVYGNADGLFQVIANLLSNANEHTQSGEITLQAELGTDDKAITVTVRDSGEGVAAEILPRVFERGVTGAERTGVGLSICKDIIESHGGIITVTSEQGKGTEVLFTLPVLKAEETEDD